MLLVWKLWPLILITSCSLPDLTDPEVWEEAKESATELTNLKRKFMYGMFHLYVEKDDQPYTGWVKSTIESGELVKLGYLKQGRKEGMWMDWYESGRKKSQIHWTEDRMDGPFLVWHEKGPIKVVGQTKDGEVDGQWNEFYSNGQLASRSLNRTGHLVDISVWKPDGTACNQSKVNHGNGSFLRYFENGSVEYKRVFSAGVEISREEFNQR